MQQNIGKIAQIIGAVVDIRFENENLPKIYEAIVIKHKDIEVICEVAQHIGDNVVRCVAMSSTDGLVRGMEAIATGNPIQAPVGQEVLGRLINVLGKAIDNKEDIDSKEKWSIHREAPKFEDQKHQLKYLKQVLKL